MCCAVNVLLMSMTDWTTTFRAAWQSAIQDYSNAIVMMES